MNCPGFWFKVEEGCWAFYSVEFDCGEPPGRSLAAFCKAINELLNFFVPFVIKLPVHVSFCTARADNYQAQHLPSLFNLLRCRKPACAYFRVNGLNGDSGFIILYNRSIH
jgi:hypothetical protein